MLDRYANHLRAAGKAESTVAQRVGRIVAVAHYLDHDLLGATTDQLEEFLAMRRNSHSAEARKSIRSAMRSFYQWAQRTGLIEKDPSFDLLPIPIPRVIPRLAPDDEIQLSLIAATTQQKAMILLGRLACLRLTELTTLHTKHREGDQLRITGKGSKQRMVPINPDLLPLLLLLERTQGPGYYFPGRYGSHMHPASVNKIITRVTGWNPHSLRHAGATAAYRSTRDLRAVQELLGHSSLATTERYLHVANDDVRRAAAGTSFTSPVDSPHYPRRINAAA